jgi:hypothetical protein
MKTIFRIIIILFVAALVAGAFNLAVGSSSTGNTQNAALGSESGQRPTRPEGDDHESEDGASFGGGLMGILASIAKLTAITSIVLLIQKGISKLQTKQISNPGAA